VTGVLDGRRVLDTRERPGELAAMLEALGAEVIHIPLIRVVDTTDGELERHLARLADFDWVVVTSAAGAQRVAGAVAATPGVRVAAVGTTTAATLRDRAGRAADLVPQRQHAEALVDALSAAAPTPQRFLVAQGDRAADTLQAGLRRLGHDVTAVTAYRTELQPLPADVVERADALLLASGSAAEAWAATVGGAAPPIPTPRIVVSIGPTTTAVAEESGLKVTATATDHSLSGLIAMLSSAFGVPQSEGTEQLK
jgi:uroporphyrinogen-III synthase